MKVLVTGGAGYIGSVAVERLIARGHKVVVVDNLCLGHRAAVHPAAALEVTDLANVEALDHVFARHMPEAVMHFASRSLVGESMQHPFRYLGDNYQEGLNLLGVVARRGVRRFILSSTANLFDRPERLPIDEQAIIRPGSPYGEAKYFLERALHWVEQTHGMRYACLRYFNAAGATQERGEDHRPESHLIPLVLQVAQGKRASVTLFGTNYRTRDGTCVRDYVHVSDLADAHILALDALDGGSRTFNLGNGRGFSVAEVVAVARQVTGREIPVEIGSRRPGDVAELVAGSDNIRRELGWQPKLPELRDIIASAWEWHQRNPDGYPAN